MVSFKKTKDFKEESNTNQVVEVDNSSTFAWTAESTASTAVDTKSTAPPLDNNAVAAGLVIETEAAIAENTAEKDLDSSAKHTTCKSGTS